MQRTKIEILLSEKQLRRELLKAKRLIAQTYAVVVEADNRFTNDDPEIFVSLVQARNKDEAIGVGIGVGIQKEFKRLGLRILSVDAATWEA